MRKKRNLVSRILISTLAVLGIAFVVQFFGNSTWSKRKTLTEKAVLLKQKNEKESFDHFNFNLVDPEQAPEQIRKLVIAGYQIMINTPAHAGKYVGDRLSCTNCHFSGGNTTGGKGGGISLAGVGAIYPKYDERSKKVIDLPTRINSCFERSMNGRPLPLESQEMLELVTYIQWISRGMPVYSKVSWLGLPKLKSAHIANVDNGQKVYDAQCSLCHGKNGEGEPVNQIPPVWGPYSYNKEAGLNKVETLASFIHYNMPYQEPTLSVEDALDVAEYISKQPRS